MDTEASADETRPTPEQTEAGTAEQGGEQGRTVQAKASQYVTMQHSCREANQGGPPALDVQPKHSPKQSPKQSPKGPPKGTQVDAPPPKPSPKYAATRGQSAPKLPPKPKPKPSPKPAKKAQRTRQSTSGCKRPQEHEEEVVDSDYKQKKRQRPSGPEPTTILDCCVLSTEGVFDSRGVVTKKFIKQGTKILLPAVVAASPDSVSALNPKCVPIIVANIGMFIITCLGACACAGRRTPPPHQQATSSSTSTPASMHNHVAENHNKTSMLWLRTAEHFCSQRWT